jgi:hypothetical protein
MSEISNTADVIDSRDVIARIEEIEEMLADLESVTLTNDERRDASLELAALKSLASEAESSPDWIYGETLIRESHFTDYIEQLIDDCYEMPKELNSGDWPWRHVTVDYEAAAEEAKADYIECDFDGVTYLIRA